MNKLKQIDCWFVPSVDSVGKVLHLKYFTKWCFNGVFVSFLDSCVNVCVIVQCQC